MNYPKDIKAFYMRQNDDGKTVAAMDVLAPGIGEIIGGSQREERLDVLDARIAEMGLHADGLLVVPRPAPLRHRAARRLRPRLRARDHVRDRHGEHPRRDPVPARAAPGGVLDGRLGARRRARVRRGGDRRRAAAAARRRSSRTCTRRSRRGRVALPRGRHAAQHRRSSAAIDAAALARRASHVVHADRHALHVGLGRRGASAVASSRSPRR